MSQRIEYQGEVHEFPDNFNDADIAKALNGGKTVAPTAPAKPKDVVGQVKEWATAEPTTPAPDLIGWLSSGKYKSTDLMDLSGARSGIRTVGGAVLPGSKGELARDVAMMAVPFSQFARGGRAGAAAANLANRHQVLTPALERTAIATAQPLLENKDVNQGLEQGAATALMEGVLSSPGAIRALRGFLPGQPPRPAVNQMANFLPPNARGETAPIVFNRTIPGAAGSPTITGGGGSMVTPTEIHVAAPRNSTPITGGDRPAVHITEPIPTHTGPMVGQGVRGAASIPAAQNPEETMIGGLGALALVNALRKQIPFLGGDHGGGQGYNQ